MPINFCIDKTPRKDNYNYSECVRKHQKCFCSLALNVTFLTLQLTMTLLCNLHISLKINRIYNTDMPQLIADKVRVISSHFMSPFH